MGTATMQEEKPNDALRRLCRDKGRRHGWVAEQLGLTAQAFSDRVTGRTRISYLEAKELAAIFDEPLETFWKEGAA